MREFFHPFGKQTASIIEGDDFTRFNQPDGVVAFRGDNREPELIFRFGFQRRDAKFERWRAFGPHNAFPMWRPSDGDIEPNSAVCVSLRAWAATLFPLATSVIDSWVYAVVLETGFDTHALQRQKKEEDALFIVEKCCMDIPCMHVLAAVKCQRKWASTEWQEGMYFRMLGRVLWNPRRNGTVGLANKEHTINAVFNTYLNRGPKIVLKPKVSWPDNIAPPGV
jgi:hypothetical protein